ncbi:MAG: hypothetical protein ACO1SV_25140 [Fimbriimonas sp.]
MKTRRWTLYVDPDDFLPRGYDLYEGKTRKQSIRYDLANITTKR